MHFHTTENPAYNIMESYAPLIALPPELWDHVIGELSSDPPSLRACGLTQRTWVSSTRRHLFKEIELKGSADCRRFRDILLLSAALGTGIAQHVCDITLSKIRLRLGFSADSVTTDVPLLEEILSSLPNVICLRLDDVDVSYAPARPSTRVHGYPDKPLQSLFTLPRLQTLYLVALVFNSPFDTMMLLAAFPQASSLHLRFCVHMDGAPMHWPPQLPENEETDQLMCIRELTVAAMTETACVMSALRQPPFSCALRKLQWSQFSTDDEDSLLLDIVQEVEGTLEELEIHCAAGSELFEKMDLSNHRHLISLRVAAMRMMDTEPIEFHPSFPTFLSRTPISLRALHLPISLALSRTDGIVPWSIVDWTKCDEALRFVHSRNPLLVAYLRLYFGLRQDGRLPETVQPLTSRFSSALRAGVRVRLVVGGYIPGPGGSVPEEQFWL
ncbi:hypothetical protein DAEQUDRAFT_204392 [Daedalea quercina L-15889]|uniref:F-box domain-containing protein n=1 Tax=Daedalea quercina L-15889 TaxID=1314783 RepID=A0A165R7K6_9APHY|nr:hypothetical protein DAEQUDRAFT_204392 [Daedalea quercina L-15889]